MRTCVYVWMVLEALWLKACHTNDSSLFWSLFLCTVFLLWCFSSALFILPNALWDTTGKEKPTLCLCSVSSRLHISNSLRNFCFWLNCQVAENNFQDPTQSEQTLHAAKPLRHSLFFSFYECIHRIFAFAVAGKFTFTSIYISVVYGWSQGHL